MLAISFLGLAQVNKQQAVYSVLNSVIGSAVDNVNVYMEPLLKSDSYYKMSQYDSIQAPYASYWLFFIDDRPEYGWGHDCRYVFVDHESAAISIRNSLTPPWHYKMKLETVSEPIGFNHFPLDTLILSDTGLVAEPVEGKYAVLFSGGEVVSDDIPYFWNALSHSYCGLIKNGFKRENIFVLSYNGNIIDSSGHMTNRYLDLNQDGINDILEDECSVRNLQSVFNSLSTIMEEGDLLYVFGVMHGSHNVNDTTSHWLWLWNQEPLYDTVFANMLSQINCSQIMVNIWACYGGGMADEIISIPNAVRKTVLTATDKSHGIIRNQIFALRSKMDVYNYFMNTALRYCHVDYDHHAPWISGVTIGQLQDTSFFSPLFTDFHQDINYDLSINNGNGNGISEIMEAIQYVAKYDTNDFKNRGVKHYDCGFKDDLLSLHGITGNVVSEDTVSGTFHIEDSLVIRAKKLTMDEFAKFYLFDADLIIPEFDTLLMRDSTAIIARSGDCRIVVRGTLILGQGVTFEARDGATLEIVFNDNSDLAVSNATFINCDLVMPQRNISFVNCHFHGTPFSVEMLPTGNFTNSVTLTNCEFTPNGKDINEAVHLKYCQSYVVQSCSVDGSGDGYFGNGIAIYNCGSNINSTPSCVRNNSVTGCLKTGLLMYATNGVVRMNVIEENGFGVKLLNNCNIAQFTGNCEATTGASTQYIHDNERYEVFMTANCVPQTFRYNYIADDDQVPFVYHDVTIGFDDPGVYPRSDIDVSLNYWGTSFNPSTHLYTNETSTGYVYQPTWVMGNCANIDGLAAAALLSTADSLSNIGSYAMAKSTYMQVVANYPNTVSAETALKSLFVLEEYAGNNYTALKAYYKNNASIASDENLSHLASSLANKCDEKLGNYEEAIGWYENVLTNPNAGFNDSIFAAIDLGDLYLRMIEGVEKVTYGKMTQYKPESIQAHKLHTYAALDLLPKVQLTNTLRKRDLSSIVNFEIEITENDTVFLDWDIPADVTEATLSWSNMIQYNALGMAAGQCATDQAVRFNTTDTEDFVGWRIKDVSVILSSSDTTTGFPEPNYSIRIWKGTGNAFEQVYEKDIIDPEYSVPFTVPIDDLVCVEEDRDLLIGYSLDKYTTFPWVVDNRQQNGKEFWYMFYHRNYPETDCLADNYWYNTEDYPSGSLCVAATIISSDSFTTNKNIASLTGYRIYRDGTLIKEIPYSFVTYFTDTEFTRETEVEYCVTAVYGEEESEPVCATATITGVGEAMTDDAVTLSPNPTNGIVRIDGATAAEVKVYNALGQLVKTALNTNQIDMSQLHEGFYLLRITATDGRVHVGKVTVNK